MFHSIYASANLVTSLYITIERWLSWRPNLWMCPRVKKAKKARQRRGDGRRSILYLCRFFEWIMCGMNRGRDAPRALWDNKTVCLANQDGNDSPTHPSVLLSCELTSAQAAFIMLGAGLCTTPFLFLWVLRWHCRTSGVFPPAPGHSSFCLEADYSASYSCLDRSSGTTVCLCVTTLHEPAPQTLSQATVLFFLKAWLFPQ